MSNKEFENNARDKDENILSELIAFLKHNKKWWLAPILAILLILGVLIFMSGTGLAPFIYTLF